jgi:hypothetical protein
MFPPRTKSSVRIKTIRNSGRLAEDEDNLVLNGDRDAAKHAAKIRGDSEATASAYFCDFR